MFGRNGASGASFGDCSELKAECVQLTPNFDLGLLVSYLATSISRVWGSSKETLTILRVLIADDHSLFRRGLKAIIERHVGWTVCAEASTGREAVELAEKLRPDIAVLDITMPELNGIEAARRITRVSENTQVLVLSAHYADDFVRAAIEAGVRGYILKSDAERDLHLAIGRIANRQPFFTPLATLAIMNDFGAKGSEEQGAASEEDELTSREREILQMLSEGKSSKDIADALGLSVKTAETHRANIMRKLKIHNLAELVRYAVRKKIVEP